jgi:hypothetical protein
MPRAGFGPAIPMFQRPKTVRALGGVVIGTGHKFNLEGICKFKGKVPVIF